MSNAKYQLSEEEQRAWNELMEWENEQDRKRRLDIRRMRRLVNYPFRWIGGILYDSSWYSRGIVNAVQTDYRSYSYPNHTFLKISEDGYHVMKQDERKNFHTLVIQWERGMEDDSFGGFIYFPLKDGRYWKVEYSC